MNKHFRATLALMSHLKWSSAFFSVFGPFLKGTGIIALIKLGVDLLQQMFHHFFCVTGTSTSFATSSNKASLVLKGKLPLEGRSQKRAPALVISASIVMRKWNQESLSRIRGHSPLVMSARSLGPPLSTAAETVARLATMISDKLTCGLLRVQNGSRDSYLKYPLAPTIIADSTASHILVMSSTLSSKIALRILSFPSEKTCSSFAHTSWANSLEGDVYEESPRSSQSMWMSHHTQLGWSLYVTWVFGCGGFDLPRCYLVLWAVKVCRQSIVEYYLCQSK